MAGGTAIVTKTGPETNPRSGNGGNGFPQAVPLLYWSCRHWGAAMQVQAHS
jgi:hypothetical protein